MPDKQSHQGPSISDFDGADMFDIDTEALDEFVAKAAQEGQRRIDRAIRGAIRAGYDGVDINRDRRLTESAVPTPASIIPWNHPAPESPRGHRTERYQWDWFSDEELAHLLTADNPMSALDDYGGHNPGVCDD